MALRTINPTTNKIEKEFNEFSENEIYSIIKKSHEEYKKWKNTSFNERAKILTNAAKVLREGKKEYARLMTIEMGKPIVQAESEVEKCAWVCDFYAENAELFLAKEIIKTDASESFVRFDPLGVILAVMPWNFPFWQVFRFAAPALMAGNAALLKHASNVTGCAVEIEKIFAKAGLPEGLFKTLLISSSKVKHVINNNLVKAVTLTGSEYAGSEVASLAGKNIKKTVMELGGSDPFIVLEDANLDEAVEVGTFARLMNNGQSCIAAKRFIVQKNIATQFLEKFTDSFKKVKIGDPLNKDTYLGPVAREDLLIELDEQIRLSVDQGAEIVYGGKRIERDGNFIEPTIITNLSKGMPAYDEELFGPVASVIIAEDEYEAVEIANSSDYGLGASVWTNDIEKAKRMAGEIESGSVFINGLVKSDPRLPFGGIKLSGYGRELSHYGIKEFVNIKTVWIK